MDNLKTHNLLKTHIEVLKKFTGEKIQLKKRIHELEEALKEKKIKNDSKFKINGNNSINNYQQLQQLLTQ
jgi:cell division septum initiation protein DivIVA